MPQTTISSVTLRSALSASIGARAAALTELDTARSGFTAARAAARCVDAIASVYEGYTAIPFRSPEARCATIDAMRAIARDAMDRASEATCSIGGDIDSSFYDRIGTDRDRMEYRLTALIGMAGNAQAAAQDSLSMIDALASGTVDVQQDLASMREATETIRDAARDARNVASACPAAEGSADDDLRFALADCFHWIARLASGADALPRRVDATLSCRLLDAADALEARFQAAQKLYAASDALARAAASEEG